MSSSPYQGSCQCGAVQFEFRDQPLTLYACHCTECQHRSGGALRLSMWVKRAALEVLRGLTELHSFKHASGRLKVRRVCATCSTDLWAEPPEHPSLAILRPSTLIESKSFEPIAHLYTRSALPWFVFPAGAKKYGTAPDDPLELLALWQERHGKSPTT